MKTINLKHFPKVIVLLVGLAFLTFDNRIASATEILKDTASPDGIVCIALVSSVDREAYKFMLNACRDAKAAAPREAEVT